MYCKPWHWISHKALLLDLKWSVRRSSPRCGAALCSWRGGWRCGRGMWVTRVAGTAACSCASPSGCCPAAPARWTPSPAPAADRPPPPAEWWCTRHRTWKRHSKRAQLTDSKESILWNDSKPWRVTAYLFFKCCTLPRQRNLPFTMMAIRVQSASHSSILQKQTQQSHAKKSNWKHMPLWLRYSLTCVRSGRPSVPL